MTLCCLMRCGLSLAGLSGLPHLAGWKPLIGTLCGWRVPLCLGAIILAVAIGLVGRHEAPQRVPDVSAVSGMPVKRPTATPEPTSAATPTQPRVLSPTPMLDPTSRPRSELARAPYAPRAELVRLPPPRAQLIRLPEWRIGEERSVTMPYGVKVAARLKGKLVSTDMLPMFGNAIGDTWVIGDSAWVWVAAPGTGSTSWIDP